MSFKQFMVRACFAFLPIFLSVFASAADNPNPPAEPVRLIFIHHSTGQNWLDDDDGGLGIALRDNNYFVSDTNYGWGPDSIGDQTDIGDWWDWFRGPNAATYTEALYAESEKHSSYSRLAVNPDPAGEKPNHPVQVLFPEFGSGGKTSDPIPTIESNPLKGHSCGSDAHTVSNAKGIYLDLLNYFSLHPEKLFIVVAAPPLSDETWAANARAFNEWLVSDWLDGYAQKNVFVFDFYNVLTTNGGNAKTNDVGLETGNHHRWWSAPSSTRATSSKTRWPIPSVQETTIRAAQGTSRLPPNSSRFSMLRIIAGKKSPAPSTKPEWKIY
jgi:hypothetical protein